VIFNGYFTFSNTPTNIKTRIKKEKEEKKD